MQQSWVLLSLCLPYYWHVYIYIQTHINKYNRLEELCHAPDVEERNENATRTEQERNKNATRTQQERNVTCCCAVYQMIILNPNAVLLDAIKTKNRVHKVLERTYWLSVYIRLVIFKNTDMFDIVILNTYHTSFHLIRKCLSKK